MTVSTEFVTETRRAMLAGIGRWNILAISGGRVEWLDDFTVNLRISNGYSVEVEYDRGWDLFTVRRVFTRTEKGVKVRRVKGEMERVYIEDLGETAYRASCFRNGPWGEGGE